MKPYTGSRLCKLSDRGVLTLPPTILETLTYRTPAWRIFVGPHESLTCLVILDPDMVARRLAAAQCVSAESSSAAVRWRRDFGFLESLTFDKTGRFNLPEQLRDWAGLASDVLAIAAGDCIELWDPEQARTCGDKDARWLADLHVPYQRLQRTTPHIVRESTGTIARLPESIDLQVAA